MSKNMTYADRLKIEMYLNDGKTQREIARLMNRHYKYDQLRNKERAHKTTRRTDVARIRLLQCRDRTAET